MAEKDTVPPVPMLPKHAHNEYIEKQYGNDAYGLSNAYNAYLTSISTRNPSNRPPTLVDPRQRLPPLLWQTNHLPSRHDLQPV
jgi:hypothetical protein